MCERTSKIFTVSQIKQILGEDCHVDVQRRAILVHMCTMPQEKIDFLQKIAEQEAISCSGERFILHHGVILIP